jgi:hypothetical protein
MVGRMGCGPVVDAHQLGMFDFDWLDVMQFRRRRRFGHMHRTTAERGATRGQRGQFCQCHSNRHDRCLYPRSCAGTPQSNRATAQAGRISHSKETQITLRRAMELTSFCLANAGHIGNDRGCD